MADRATTLDIPEAVREIARRLEDAGYDTWTVGGGVRDALLGWPNVEWDLATAARPETVRKLFRPSYPIGLRFGTVGVRGKDGRVYELTTFRRDIETDGRHAVIEYADHIDDDLARRDFTINAIAYHPFRKEIHDPFDGCEDLERKLLRCVGEPAQRFAEDYLRVLRGLRFAGRYRLEIEPATWSALREAVQYLPRLSAERVREELLKVLEAVDASPGLDLYRQAGALPTLLPELAGLTDEEWADLLCTIDELSALRVDLRLAAFLAPAEGALEELMTRLRFSNAETRRSVEVSRGLAQPLPSAGDAVGARRWIRGVSRSRARSALHLHIARRRAAGLTSGERAQLVNEVCLVLEVLRRADPVGLADLAIDGDDLKMLGLKPSPEFGQILADCLDAVIADPSLNQRELLLEHVRARYVE